MKHRKKNLKTEFVKDLYDIEYKVVPIKFRGRVIGFIYRVSDNTYIGRFYGSTKSKMLENVRNNINIMIYDIK